MIHRRYYGWFDGAVYRLSLWPPDAPVRRSLTFPMREDVEEYVRRKRGTFVWFDTDGAVSHMIITDFSKTKLVA